MRRRHGIEFIVGLFIVAGVLALAVLAFRVSGLTDYTAHNTYQIHANFANIGDLKVRAPVTIGGVTIGRVVSITLDRQTFGANVVMDIGDHVNNIPVDSTANIFTAGLLGANYISITPGFSDQVLKNGNQLQHTNQALILQNLVGQLMFSLKHKT